MWHEYPATPVTLFPAPLMPNKTACDLSIRRVFSSATDRSRVVAAKTPRFALCLERFGNEAQQAARFAKFTKAQRGHCPL
jgi:hypothetical protein